MKSRDATSKSTEHQRFALRPIDCADSIQEFGFEACVYRLENRL